MTHVPQTLGALVVLLLVGVADAAVGSAPETIREPAVAGRFYPGDPAELRPTIESYLRAATPTGERSPIALIAPHAGYVFSGRIAALAYAQAREHAYDVIVILGTNHTTAGFRKVSIYPSGAYRTPLGPAEVDSEVAAALLTANDDFVFEPRVHQQEHSVEVQVPFVQHLFPGTRIVPVVIGRPDMDLCTRFGRALASALDGKRALVVASSDFSHYPTYDDAVSVDREVVNAILTRDPSEVKQTIARQLGRDVPGLSTCACGEGPILAAMTYANARGATRATLVASANSGDVSIGDRSRVVGYAAITFTDGPAEPSQLLSHAERRTLLSIARETIRHHLRTGSMPALAEVPERLTMKRGVFVTLKRNGQLRGCIGHMRDDTPLSAIVAEMAVASATSDHRFAPVTREELRDIEIEISVLTPYQPIEGPEEIVLGRDGILLRKGGHSAVYLPQVATEQGWSLEETLEHLCRKAGVSSNCWTEDATLLTFQAEVFGEAEFR